MVLDTTILRKLSGPDAGSGGAGDLGRLTSPEQELPDSKLLIL
jgi:hypothetical protein